jgi:hypothetical protein
MVHPPGPVAFAVTLLADWREGLHLALHLHLALALALALHLALALNLALAPVFQLWK